jgi:photosystem II stability/assembly factor-like uncharacterized protein
MRGRVLVLLALAGLLVLAAFTSAAVAGAPSNNPDWSWQNQLPRGTTVDGIAIVDGGGIWTVSDGSQHFLHSTDNGATWTTVGAASSFGAHKIVFPDATHGYAIGTDTLDPSTLCGIVYRSDDGGHTWDSDRIIYGGDALLTDLSFPTVDDGWVVGADGIVMATTDGGDSWDLQATGSDADFEAVCFIDASRGWVVGSRGTIVATSDGGNTWSRQAGPDRTDLRGVAMASDGSHGWAVGMAGSIWRTTDGTSWSEQDSPTGEDFSAVVCADASRAWAVTRSGSIVRTTDGSTWRVTARAPERLWTLAVSGSTLWAGGDSGLMMRSADGGATWSRVGSSFTSRSLQDVDAIDRTRAWAVGERGLILRTRDGGATWTRQRVPVTNTLNGVSLGTRRSGFAVGNAGTILRTTNAGARWVRAGRPVRSRLVSVSAVDSRYVWAVGNRGTILRSTDGGRHWKRQKSHTRADLSSVTFVDRRHGWAVGGQNILLRTSDGGRHWKKRTLRAPIKHPDPQAFYSVCFVDRRHGWIAAAGGGLPGYSVLRTTDGGRSWRWTQMEFGSFMLDVSFSDRRHGCAVGEQSVMYTSQDGGRTWDFQGVTDGIGGLAAVDMVDATTGWTVGPFGAILKTEP